MKTLKKITTFAVVAATLTSGLAVAEAPGTTSTLYRQEQAKISQQNAEVVRKIFREFLTTDKRQSKAVAKLILSDSRNISRNIGIMQDEIDGLEMIVRANSKTDDKIAQLEHELRIVAGEYNQTISGRRALYATLAVLVGAVVGGVAGASTKNTGNAKTALQIPRFERTLIGIVMGTIGGSFIGDSIRLNMKDIDENTLDLDEYIDSN